MKTITNATLLSLSLIAATLVPATVSANGRTVEVAITNLTNATYFTELLIAAHDSDFHLFQTGTSASANLQAMAEGGSLTGLVADVSAAGGSYVQDPAGGVLAPGVTTEAPLEIGRHARHLSVTAMLLPSNDGFVGLDGLPIPRRRGVYTYYLLGYDAGTETNDEQITGGGAPGVPGIPVDPGGNQGSNGTGLLEPDRNLMVHVHRGVVGDLSPTDGPSDLDTSIHRWLNPVAKLTLTIGRGGN